MNDGAQGTLNCNYNTGSGRRGQWPLFTIAVNAASVIIFSPSCTARRYFEPGLLPTITRSVSFETELTQSPPAPRMAALTASRSIDSSVPVTATFLPCSGPLAGGFDFTGVTFTPAANNASSKN